MARDGAKGGSFDLFEHDPDRFDLSAKPGSHEPLASRMRPRTLDDFIGQGHLVGPGRLLRKALEGSGPVPSMILWGPPGCGKTTLAQLIARQTKSRFVALSAVGAGVAQIRQSVEEAKKWRTDKREGTILFIDEIHRFNKSQQDALLPHVEKGDVTLIGATTENPSFEVNSALLSRTRVFTLKTHTDEDVAALLDRALVALEGLDGKVTLAPDARDFIVRMASGDARSALNALELAATLSLDVGVVQVTEALQRTARYDKAGSNHYDTISAFIKSIRGSDTNGALYWLVRMIDAGEDPLFISRRLVILAAEDVGLADPQALTIASSAQAAVHLIGLPEGYYPLAEATIYLSLAPKSDSVKRAYASVMADLESTREHAVPLHLRNASTSLMKEQGYGQGYRYAHEAVNHFDPKETFLPPELQGHQYYAPTAEGYEAKLKERYANLEKLRQTARANTTS